MTTTLNQLLRGSVGTPCIVGPPLTESERAFFPQANKHVLWGWKRDSGLQSRSVYFSGTLRESAEGVSVEDRFFFYRHRTYTPSARSIVDQFETAIPKLNALSEMPCLSIERFNASMSTVRFAFGNASVADKDRVSRLLRRKPRTIWKSAETPRTTERIEDVLSLFPVDAYLGSGVSYECGLPTLCEMHDFFCLDDHAKNAFTHGDADQLPRWFADDPHAVIRGFCSLGVKALSAQPSRAQRIVGHAFNQGLIQQVLSDNVDNMLAKVAVPFERTRGSGVFNERHPVTFKTNTLLVVGVAADRREIIAQARRKAMRIIVVDPLGKVSHGVQHLNFLRNQDLFYRWTADEFFTKLARSKGIDYA